MGLAFRERTIMGMYNLWQKDEIPYQEQANRLFNLRAWRQNKTEQQQLIPFLGAGVSISCRQWPQAKADVPDLGNIDKLVQELGLTQQAATTFFRIAVFLALRLEAADKDNVDVNDEQLLDYLVGEKYPPSAGELARLFSHLSPYTSFNQIAKSVKSSLPPGVVDVSDAELVRILKLLARITRIANPPDALTSITGYFENKNGRDSLWQNLQLIISDKKEVTTTHRLLAAAAKQYLSRPDVHGDYLILTTNYDCLMEDALDEAEVPYVVLATRRSDQKVVVRFSKTIGNAAALSQQNSGVAYAKQFKFEDRPSESLVLIFKLHGCLYSELTDKDDGLVISDNDYIDYISQMNSNEGRIPPDVNTLMQDKPFLFLGYSLSDWNVRSVFQSLRKKRGADFRGQDYSVMAYSGDYERLFFQTNEVAILETDLNTYCAGIIDVIKKLGGDQWHDFVASVLKIVKV
jgi:hypothetical protein